MAEITPVVDRTGSNASLSGVGHADTEKQPGTELQHIEAAFADDKDVAELKWDIVNEEANRAEEFEHSIGFWKSVKTYRSVSLSVVTGTDQTQAVFWSFVASLSIIMEGYDGSVGGGVSLYEYRKVIHCVQNWWIALNLTSTLGSITPIWTTISCLPRGKGLSGKLVTLVTSSVSSSEQS